MNFKPVPRWLALMSAVVLLHACGSQSEAELLASAKDYLAKNDVKAAVIQLKSALQQNAQSAETRYLLGKALLDSGDVTAAIVELRKAAELKHPDHLVTPALARALLATGEDRKVTDAYAQTTFAEPLATAELKTTLAMAYARQGKQELVETAIAAALASTPKHGPALLMKARLAAGKQDFTLALATLDQVIANGNDPEAWLLKAEILQHAQRDNAGALAAYRKAIEGRSSLMAAHQGVVTVLLGTKDQAGAQAHVDQLKKTHPDLPQTRLLDAQMAFVRQDFQATRTIAAPLLQLAPNNPLLLQLAGAAEYQLNALPQAANLLEQALKIAPGLPLSRMLLARTYLRTGEADKALETLGPLILNERASGEALGLAAESYLQSGDMKRAEEYFLRAAKVLPDDPRIRTAVALGQIGKGNTAGGLAELQSVSASDPGATANLALVATHLRRNEIDKALEAINALEKKQPDKPLAANLRGRVLMMRKDTEGARASFERAYQIDPAYFPAVASLAALDLAEKKPEAARKRFDDLLKADPGNYRASLALAALLSRTGGDATEITRLLETVIAANPTEASARIQLVDHHLTARNPKAALSVAQNGVAAMPTSRELTHALGRAQLASADYQQAVTSFNRLATLLPKSPTPPLGLAEAALGLKDPATAERHLKRALELSPQLLAAQRTLARLMVNDRRYPEAIALARSVQQQRPGESAGFLLEGDIEQHRKNWDAAIAVYRTGLQKSNSPEAAIKVHGALVGSGKASDAERHAAAWLKDHPKDAAFRFYLGDAALTRDDWAQAESHYREVLQIRPEDPLALNNVAWLMVKQRKPGAVAYAEKATGFLKNQPALMDTLAVALAAESQLPRALEMQKKTVQSTPDDHQFRLNLARMYLQAGDKTLARAELETLAKLGKRFAAHAEVAELLKTV